jgi:hypothetical protein
MPPVINGVMSNKRRRVLVQFEIDDEARRDLRHRAIDLNLSAAEILRRAVKAFLAGLHEQPEIERPGRSR